MAGRSSQVQVPDELGNLTQKRFQDFLETFTVDGQVKYVELAKEQLGFYSDGTLGNTLIVDFADVQAFQASLAVDVQQQYERLYPFLCLALRNVCKNILDKQPDSHHVSFENVGHHKDLRNVLCADLGSLITTTGQAIHVGPIHPELILGTFRCEECHFETTGVEQQFKLTYPAICGNDACNNRRRFKLLAQKSVLSDQQELTVQEVPQSVRRGCVPVRLEVTLRHNIADESVQPGACYKLTGTLLARPVRKAAPGVALRPAWHQDDAESGVRGLKHMGVAKALHHDFIFMASSVEPIKASLVVGEVDENVIERMRHDEKLWSNMAQSIFPSIKGYELLKQGIVLMLIGGVRKKTSSDNLRLRDDIHCLIVGVPSTAKSTLLHEVQSLIPGAVFVTGTGTTAAGLTASVVREFGTGVMSMKPGALCLANEAVCCIDDFDKLKSPDLVSVHEAMEQGTISIAKGGIRAVIQTKAAILASATPVGGKYDTNISFEKNVKISGPLLSRFDLVFVLPDFCDENADSVVAKAILAWARQMPECEPKYSKQEILSYIEYAKRFEPVITKPAADLLVQQYVELRQRRGGPPATIRQLESFIRLAEAVAKLNLVNEVEERHVRAVMKLRETGCIDIDNPPVLVDQPDVDEYVDAISVEKYWDLANLFALHLQRSEGDMKRSQLIEWYLESQFDQIGSVRELEALHQQVDRTISRLIGHDHVLLASDDSTDPVLKPNPEYNIN